MEEKFINVTLKVWRQKQGEKKGKIETYQAKHISTDASFLEMLDIVNDDLTVKGIEPIAFDHDCREGICGMCGQVVNGYAHGEEKGTTLCQFHMRRFKDGDTIFIEPFRAKAFKVIKDLVVDRSAFDKIIQAGGYITAKAGGAPDANIFPITYETCDLSMSAAECIGCGACVASCPNASAMLFVSAKISHLALLPQGRPEAAKRALAMVRTMDSCGFGNCSNERECENSCPKNISITNIARMNREFLAAGVLSSAM